MGKKVLIAGGIIIGLLILLGLIGSIAEMESERKSERVKIAFKNHKGKKWGRPKVHTNKIKIILDLYNQGLSYREINKKSGLSIGAISKVLNVHKNKLENKSNNLELNEQLEKD